MYVYYSDRPVLDGFAFGAGAATGALAAVAGAQFVSNLFDNAQRKYREQKFDPYVRHDAICIYNYGQLDPAAYPFPVDGMTAREQEKTKSSWFGWFKRHPFLSMFILLMILVYVGSLLSTSSVAEDGTTAVDMRPLEALLPVIGSIICISIIYAFVRFGHHTKRTVIHAKKLEEYGREYWEIREDIQRRLAQKTVSPEQAFRELCTTTLVSQLPDTEVQFKARARQEMEHRRTAQQLNP